MMIRLLFQLITCISFILFISANEIIEFAPVFRGINSKTIGMGCKYNNMSICCTALNKPQRVTPDLGVHIDDVSTLQQTGHCITTKKYIPSPYEQRHLEKALEISKLSDLKDREKAIYAFMLQTEEIEAAKKWLERVKTRMHRGKGKSDKSGFTRKGSDGKHRSLRDRQRKGVWRRMHDFLGEQTSTHEASDAKSNFVPQVHPDDEEYLSKFLVERQCSGNGHKGSVSRIHWVEWIEPLSVHARHPFGE